MDRPPPRLFGIVAADAPTVAVIRRGPTAWCHVSKWDLVSGTVEHGSWLHGTIAPQKCDLSPDGVWLAYSAVKYPGDWEGGAVYEAISRLPWLTALAAWHAGTTYTRGVHFVRDTARNELGPPDAGDLGLRGCGLALTSAEQFAVEKRRGWVEAETTPPRAAGGPWDEDRSVEMIKPQPRGGAVLRVSGAFAAFRSAPGWHQGNSYGLSTPNGDRELDGVQWADWGHDGRLLVATDAGHLERRDVDDELTVLDSHDLSGLAVDPQPPPPEARRW